MPLGQCRMPFARVPCPVIVPGIAALAVLALWPIAIALMLTDRVERGKRADSSPDHAFAVERRYRLRDGR